jgi:hypothetical protein
MKILQVGAELFMRTDGQTLLTKLIVAFAILRTCLTDAFKEDLPIFEL